MTVDILMATYNGERHLRNQLLSLQQQTHRDWVLWVRDDGSTDGTLAVIESFARADDRIRLVAEGSGQGLGAGRNFLGLTPYVTAEYAIFCDQDDIWFEKKLEILVDFAARNFDERLPCLVYCDGYGYSDADGVITIRSISRLHATNLEGFLFFNSGYQGCSILFNRALNDIVSGYRTDCIYMHDDVVSLVGHVFGKVHFIPKCLMLYRQHASNATGNISGSLLSRFRRVLGGESFVLSRKHFEEKKAFYEAYRDDLGDRAGRLFAAYLEYPRRGLVGRLWLICRWGFSLGGRRLPLLVKTLICRPLG